MSALLGGQCFEPCNVRTKVRDNIFHVFYVDSVSPGAAQRIENHRPDTDRQIKARVQRPRIAVAGQPRTTVRVEMRQRIGRAPVAGVNAPCSRCGIAFKRAQFQRFRPRRGVGSR